MKTVLDFPVAFAVLLCGCWIGADERSAWQQAHSPGETDDYPCDAETPGDSDSGGGESDERRVLGIAGGGDHSLALFEDGTVMAWGYNFYGELGDGTTDDSPVPVSVIGISEASGVAAGVAHSLAALDDGTVLAWGWNQYGQLGDGTRTSTYSSPPTEVLTLSDVVDIAAGAGHSLAVSDDLTVKVWGWNEYGQQGIGTEEDSSAPAAISRISGVDKVSAGLWHSLALLDDQSVLSWGHNLDGALGDGTNEDSTVPVPALVSTPVVDIAAGERHSLALLGDGTVVAWGSNYYGELGDGSDANRSTPVVVRDLEGVEKVAAGEYFSLALLSDGTVMRWGCTDHEWEDWGVDCSAFEQTPVPVSGLSNVEDIAAGSYHSLALLDDGSVVAWGLNRKGQLGDGTYADSNSPVSVAFPSQMANLTGCGCATTRSYRGGVLSWLLALLCLVGLPPCRRKARRAADRCMER